METRTSSGRERSTCKIYRHLWPGSTIFPARVEKRLQRNWDYGKNGNPANFSDHSPFSIPASGKMLPIRCKVWRHTLVNFQDGGEHVSGTPPISGATSS